MKLRFVTLGCAILLGCGSGTPVHAISDGGPEAVAVDAVLVRPMCLAATAVGSALFIVTLPFAAISKSTKKSADALVGRAARATFTRPMGEFSTMTREE
jgi:hypothetical protein